MIEIRLWIRGLSNPLAQNISAQNLAKKVSSGLAKYAKVLSPWESGRSQNLVSQPQRAGIDFVGSPEGLCVGAEGLKGPTKAWFPKVHPV